MNRFARILQGFGALAAGLWLAVAAQGYLVVAEGPELAIHTVIALAAGALTLFTHSWTLSFLLLGADRFASPPARAARRTALAAATLVLVALALQFATSGRVVWGSIPGVAHAVGGAALLLAHVAALRLERRALRLESRARPE